MPIFLRLPKFQNLNFKIYFVLGPLTGWLDDVKFIIFLIVLVIFDIMALNFEILHAVDWLQHKDHINKVDK